MVGGGHQHDGKEICSPSSYQICNFPCHTSTLLHPSLVNTLQKKDEAVTLKEEALKCGWEGRKVENDGSHSPVSQLVSNDFFRSLRRHPNGQSIFYCLLWNFHDFGLAFIQGDNFLTDPEDGADVRCSLFPVSSLECKFPHQNIS